MHMKILVLQSHLSSTCSHMWWHSIRGSCCDYYHVFADVLCKVCRADAAAWSVFNKRTRLFHFTPLWSSPLDLCYKMYSRGQRVSCWCERQGEVGLFDLIFFFFFFSLSRLSNSLPCMHDVKQHEYKVTCMWPYSLHLSPLPSPPIKTLPHRGSTECLHKHRTHECWWSGSEKYNWYISAAQPVWLRAGCVYACGGENGWRRINPPQLQQRKSMAAVWMSEPMNRDDVAQCMDQCCNL